MAIIVLDIELLGTTILSNYYIQNHNILNNYNKVNINQNHTLIYNECNEEKKNISII